MPEVWVKLWGIPLKHRKVDRVVGTVEFNDPYTDPADVTRSPEELLEARQEAWRAQAQLIAMARGRLVVDVKRTMLRRSGDAPTAVCWTDPRRR